MELEKEQLEADLRFKSKELSGVVMTNIAHQEFLNSLKEELQQQKLSGQYTRKNLDKLLSMINQNMVSDEENWNMFQSNFDRIHENFFRNLKEKFPDLTSGDLRLCALLRLNLPTKEIAKLMNISVRGVEAGTSSGEQPDGFYDCVQIVGNELFDMERSTNAVLLFLFFPVCSILAVWVNGVCLPQICFICIRKVRTFINRY